MVTASAESCVPRGLRASRKEATGDDGAPAWLHGESGAAIIEAAILTPIFFWMLFGILEFGLLFKDYLSLSHTATAGARSAAILGNEESADFEILKDIRAEGAALDIDNIVRVVVFRAEGPTDSIDNYAGCKGGSDVAGRCNSYSGGDLTNTNISHFDCSPNPAPILSNPWCPTTRRVAANDNPVTTSVVEGPPGYLGVYIVYTHPFVTGLFGSERTLTSQAVVKLEPQTLF